MKAPLRIALTLFSYEAWQSWVILVCGVVIGIGFLVREYDVSAVFAIFMVMGPAFGGGLVLRSASSPTVLHLRPHGRCRILLGATGTITLVALVWTMPVLVFQLTGLRIPDGSSVFDLPALDSLQWSWGATALLWVGSFAASRFQLLHAVSGILFFVPVILFGQVHIPPNQLAGALFVAGAAAWSGLAFWYLRTPSVTRPIWIVDRARAQPPLDPGQWLARLRSTRSSAGEAAVSRPVALCQYLTGSDSTWMHVLGGAALALLIAVVIRFAPVDDVMEADGGLKYVVFFSLIGATSVYPNLLVRRARLLWLRAGLDRGGLFAAAERHALRVQLATFMAPSAVLVAMATARAPDLAAAIFLFAATLLIAATCFLYASLGATRGWNARSFGLFIVLGVPLFAMTGILQPHRGAPIWPYLATMAVSGGLVLVLRNSALRAWQRLDWRVAGPPLARVGQQRS